MLDDPRWVAGDDDAIRHVLGHDRDSTDRDTVTCENGQLRARTVSSEETHQW